MMELTGTLDCFPLRELLELMQESSMCGLLEIQGSRGSGFVASKDGMICHAEYADQIGMPALWMLFEETDAPFAIRANRHLEVRQTMLGDAGMLSDEGEERARAWKPIRARIPDTSLIPVINPLASGRIALDPIDQTVLAAIDNVRTIDELAEQTFMELIDVCRSLIRLMDADAIRLKHGAQPQPKPAQPASNISAGGAATLGAAEPKNGLFRRPLGTEPANPTPTTGLLGRLAQQRH